MTSKERVLKTLQRQEPDFVPVMELTIDQKVRDQILPGATYEDFIDHFDMDAGVVFDKVVEKYFPVDETKGIVRDEWGVIRQFTKETISHPLEPAIKSEADIDHYRAPDPDAEYKFDMLKSLGKRFKGQRAIVATINDVFYTSQAVRGSEQHFMDFIENPNLVDRLNEIVLNYCLKYIRNCIEAGADIILIGGDYASAKGPMMSPRHFKRFVFPPLKAMVTESKTRGAYCLKHTDGNIWKIFDMIVESGIDGIHPLEPVAGMDIGEAKLKYGDRITVMGNVDCGYTLSWGTAEEVRKAVRDCIKKAAPGGGYILSSSNSIHSSVKPDNFIEMLKAAREFGKYPIHLD